MPSRKLAALALLLALPGPASGQQVTARPADVASLDGIVAALYASVQRPPGQTYDWDRFGTLFLPQAVLVPATEQTGGRSVVLSPDGFIVWIEGLIDVDSPDDPGFQEEEVARRTHAYGDVAQIFSTYQSRYWGSEEIVARGINSMNLVRKDGRWWFASIVWDEEAGAGPIPPDYLTGR